MRSKWNSTIDLGLISLAVQTYSARDFDGATLHQFHQGCSGSEVGQVGRQPYCKSCGEVVGWDAIVKGVERDDGVVLLTDDEIDECRGDATGYEIVSFVPAEQIDPLWLDGADYLVPNAKGSKTAAKTFAVIRDALIETGRWGIVRYTNRGVSHIAVLRVHDNHQVLVLQNLVWASQVRAPEFEVLSKPVTVTPEESKLMRQLMDTMVGDFEHASYVDTYAEQVEALVDAKAAGVSVPVTRENGDGGGADVSDLLAKLEASIAAKEERQEVKQRHPSRRRKTSAA